MPSLSRIVAIFLVSCLIADTSSPAFAHRATPTFTYTPVFTDQALTLALVTSRKPTFPNLPHKILQFLDSLFPSWRHPDEPLLGTVGSAKNHRFEVVQPEERPSPKKASRFSMLSKNINSSSDGSGFNEDLRKNPVDEIIALMSELGDFSTVSMNNGEQRVLQEIRAGVPNRNRVAKNMNTTSEYIRQLVASIIRKLRQEKDRRARDQAQIAFEDRPVVDLGLNLNWLLRKFRRIGQLLEMSEDDLSRAGVRVQDINHIKKALWERGQRTLRGSKPTTLSILLTVGGLGFAYGMGRSESVQELSMFGGMNLLSGFIVGVIDKLWPNRFIQPIETSPIKALHLVLRAA